MAKEILKVNVVEEKGEYRITISGEKAADVVKMFPCACGCTPGTIKKGDGSEEGCC
jgi:hypothetical protein